MRLIATAFLILVCISANTQHKDEQNTEPLIDKPRTDKTEDVDTTKVYLVTERTAEFPGGKEAMAKFIGKNLRYVYRKESGERFAGRIFLMFIVERDGSLTDITAESVSPSLNELAVQMVAKMPPWIPGTLRGTKVRSKVTLPIVF